MRKLWTIAGKELYTTFTNRNLLLVMLLTPLILSTIIGLAFGGGGSAGPTLANIAVVVVNLDEGLEFGAPADDATVSAASGDDSGQGFRFGDQLVTILQGEDTPAATTDNAGRFTLPPCQLVDDAAAQQSGNGGYATTLAELLDVTVAPDPATARAAVASGQAAAAVIIPAAFSRSMLPQFGAASTVPSDGAATIANPFAVSEGEETRIEVYGDRAQPVSASVVRSVVEGISSQFARSSVALGAVADSVLEEVDLVALLAAAPNLEPAPEPTASWATWQEFLTPLVGVSPWFGAIFNGGPDVATNVSCLFAPGLNVITIREQPLDLLQEQDRFSRVLVAIGSAQAVFFALFTGVFGLAGMYDERKQWTLQRLMVTPTPRWVILGGKLIGNLVVVFAQILLLLLALTGVASAMAGGLTFIWGANFVLLFVLVLALSLCVSGLGALVVGLARTQEQVQIFAPMINMTLGALGGTFGFALPVAFAQFSLIYWGVDAFQKLAAGQTAIGVHLAVLFGQGLIFFLIGVLLFRRRIDL